jgi:hypothetical protein
MLDSLLLSTGYPLKSYEPLGWAKTLPEPVKLVDTNSLVRYECHHERPRAPAFMPDINWNFSARRRN